jgi:hypothetical protein
LCITEKGLMTVTFRTGNLSPLNITSGATQFRLRSQADGQNG